VNLRMSRKMAKVHHKDAEIDEAHSREDVGCQADQSHGVQRAARKPLKLEPEVAVQI
jgi:hypothetical protein